MRIQRSDTVKLLNSTFNENVEEDNVRYSLKFRYMNIVDCKITVEPNSRYSANALRIMMLCEASGKNIYSNEVPIKIRGGKVSWLRLTSQTIIEEFNTRVPRWINELSSVINSKLDTHVDGVKALNLIKGADDKINDYFSNGIKQYSSYNISKTKELLEQVKNGGKILDAEVKVIYGINSNADCTNSTYNITDSESIITDIKDSVARISIPRTGFKISTNEDIDDIMSIIKMIDQVKKKIATRATMGALCNIETEAA